MDFVEQQESISQIPDNAAIFKDRFYFHSSIGFHYPSRLGKAALRYSPKCPRLRNLEASAKYRRSNIARSPARQQLKLAKSGQLLFPFHRLSKFHKYVFRRPNADGHRPQRRSANPQNPRAWATDLLKHRRHRPVAGQRPGRLEHQRMRRRPGNCQEHSGSLRR